MGQILIVDDHEENRYLLEFALTSAGHQVSVTSNGAEALAQARQNPPDLIVADILMPVMDGFTLCRHWRADEQLQGIPFIFYTATYTDAKDEQLGLSLGADRFITKPQEPDVLVAAVEEVIAAGVGVQVPVRQPDLNEQETLREYNEALIRKLEKKLFDLERARRQTESEKSEREQAEERGRKLLEETERSRLALLTIMDEQKAGEARIQEQLDEIRRWHTVSVGREDRIVELKREVNGLLAELGRPPRYKTNEQES